MYVWRNIVSIAFLLGMLSTRVSAAERGPWEIVSESAAANQNIVVSTILESEMEAALQSVPYSKGVIENCGESGLPPGTRVFLSDLYFPEHYPGSGGGENCILHRHSDTYITGFTTLNSAWSPMSVVGVRPSPFYATRSTFRVPTLFLSGAANLEDQPIQVLQVRLQDFRYGVLLFPNATSVASIEHTIDEILSPPYPSNLLAGGLQPIRLQIPSFVVRTDVRRDDLSSRSPRAVKIVTLLSFNQDGVGSRNNWPPLSRGRIDVSSGPPVSIVLNHPFFYAIVRYDTSSLLFAGYLAKPMLNY